MSLQHTKSTQHWASIPKKCKNCNRAIFTKEADEIYYQCSVFATFKKDCTLELEERKLLKPEEILEK